MNDARGAPVMWSLESFLSVARDDIFVPIYQRDFIWRDKEATQLTEDIHSLINGHFDKRFMGTVLFEKIPNPGPINSYTVVDGQQRITTMLLLALAVLKELQEIDEPYARNLRKDLFTSRDGVRNPYQFKLKPRLHDREPLDVILYETFQEDPDLQKILINGNMTEAKFQELKSDEENSGKKITAIWKLMQRYVSQYLTDETLDSDIDKKKEILTDLWNAFMTKMYFCVVWLENEFDPHEVFDRLNHSGVALSQYDLLRNFFFMNVPPEQRELDFLDQLWGDYFRDFETQWSPAIADDKKAKLREKYLFALSQIRKGKTSQNKIFSTLKGYYEEKYLNHKWLDSNENAGKEQATKGQVKDALKKVSDDLNEFKFEFIKLHVGITRRIEATLLKKLSANEKKEFTSEINRFSTFLTGIDESALPFVLQLFNSMRLGKIDFNKGLECLETLESFVIRRKILGEFRHGSSIFIGLWDQVSDDPKKGLCKKIEESPDERFVSDEIIKNLLTGKRDDNTTEELYKKSQISRYVVWEYDVSRRRGADQDPKDRFMRKRSFQLDHVIPQKANLDEWEGWDAEAHAKWKDSWANLAPLTRDGNAAKSAKSWKEAQNLFAGDNKYPSAKEVFKTEKWTPAEVEERANKLAEWFCERWPIPD